ncbi:MAG: ABC transporter permease [bacterium]|nr:ABC transporter permease [bacterium]
MHGRIFHIIKKEFIQIFRDKKSLPPIFIAPLFQLLVFGYVITNDIKHISTVVCDLDNTPASRQFVDSFTHAGYFNIKYRVTGPQQLGAYLDSGKAKVAIAIPHKFMQELNAGKKVPVQFLVDGSDSNNANIAIGYVSGIMRTQNQLIIAERFLKNGIKLTQLSAVECRSRVWYNEDLESRNYMIPGILCLILTIITVSLTSGAIVKERERGTLEQLIVTPIKSYELILGKLFPFIIIGFIEVFFILLVALFWFEIPMRGSLLLLLLLTAVFLLNTLGLGLLISTISKTQQQAMMLSFFSTNTALMLSGLIFPIQSMPIAIQYLTYLIPLRYFLIIIRGIFLKGVGIAALWNQIIPLAVFGVVLLTFAILRFHKRLE